MSKSIGSVALERRVDALFSRYTQPGSPGAVVGIMRDGTIELCKGYGLASIELGVPITSKTRFRIASVSKQFTVSAALMLAHEGLLKRAITSDGLDALPDVLAAIRDTGALDFARERAHQYAHSARDALTTLPRSEACDALAVLADCAIDRTR